MCMIIIRSEAIITDLNAKCSILLFAAASLGSPIVGQMFFRATLFSSYYQVGINRTSNLANLSKS